MSSIVIDAPAGKVWQLLADMRSWPQWRSDAYVIELGEMKPDAPFRWNIRGQAIKSTFAVVEPERELAWTGVAMGYVKAIDRMRLEAAGDGRTRVTIEESMAGPLLTLFYSSAKLRKGHEDMLHMLKTAAEG
ncbi:Polyketide cyclase / dehydrase and lipid transport [Nonomuraea solani]|uniref:Polyketide cyclase / dehydrase and lipid transport n=1 Tax=Nonomuraea solani TaxID=1144553 RepID=A0A1H6EE05_9ACTN|nr:SRPBCC domain-containing protein [Nonomuraea solani]SEG96048.1 Polyketide cyclase / dehydrase and lipid transport [Nonomuraea solani]